LDDHTRLLTEIRDLLACNLEKLDEAEERHGEYNRLLALYHCRQGSLRAALYVVGGMVALLALAFVIFRTR